MTVKRDTRLRMVNAALGLFHLQGVNATSVDQVLAHSETGKSQFTHYFRTKEGLVHAVLEHVHGVIQGGHAPTGYDVRSWKDLDGWFDKFIAFQESTGCQKSCPVGTIANDVTDEQALLRQDIRLFLEWSRGQLTRFFVLKKAAGELVESADPEGLADFCISIMQGGMLLTKMKRDTDMFRNASVHALAYIHTLRIRATR